MNYNKLVSTENVVPTDISISTYKPQKYLKEQKILFELKKDATMKIWLILLDINGKICVEGKLNPTFLKELYQSDINYIAYYNQGKTYLILHSFIIDFPKKIFKLF